MQVLQRPTAKQQPGCMAETCSNQTILGPSERKIYLIKACCLTELNSNSLQPSIPRLQTTPYSLTTNNMRDILNLQQNNRA